MPPNECSVNDNKQSDVAIPVMMEFWGMRNTSSLTSDPDPLWPGVVASDRVLSMGQVELNSVLSETELFKIELFCMLNRIA